ncbi:MAG: Mut7-C RNAse domain-containing protein [Planctomycetota bacterium]
MRFFCDDHLWRLARWLRAAGYDTAWERAIDDGELVARARAEGRIVLTLDRGIAARRGTGVCLLPTHDPLEQLRYVRERFDLDLDAHAFTRCPRCNGTLSETDDVEVPDRVRTLCDRFWRCDGCGQVYWHGDHVRHMRERFRSAQA